MKTVHLEVVAPTFQGLEFCTSCELVLSGAGLGESPATRGPDEYPQEWQDHFQQLGDWVYDFAEQYGDAILIKVIDPQSIEGLLKSLRYRIRKYPTWIIDGQTRVVGWDRLAVERALERSTE